MTADKRTSKRVPIALRVKLRFRKMDRFVSKFATNISTSGIFISSRKPKAPGTLLRFELRLADDRTMISGRGKVVWVKEFDESAPKAAHGMGIEFVSLSRESKEVIEKIVESRSKQGLANDGSLPFALDEKAVDGEAEEVQTAPPSSSRPENSGEEKPARNTLRLGDLAPDGVAQAVHEIETLPVDMGRVLDRARHLLHNSDPETELEDLYRVSAAPIAETVDEASHRLAQILGGTSVLAHRRTQRTKVSAVATALPNSSHSDPDTPGLEDAPEIVVPSEAPSQDADAQPSDKDAVSEEVAESLPRPNSESEDASALVVGEEEEPSQDLESTAVFAKDELDQETPKDIADDLEESLEFSPVHMDESSSRAETLSDEGAIPEEISIDEDSSPIIAEIGEIEDQPKEEELPDNTPEELPPIEDSIDEDTLVPQDELIDEIDDALSSLEVEQETSAEAGIDAALASLEDDVPVAVIPESSGAVDAALLSLDEDPQQAEAQSHMEAGIDAALASFEDDEPIEELTVAALPPEEFDDLPIVESSNEEIESLDIDLDEVEELSSVDMEALDIDIDEEDES